MTGRGRWGSSHFHLLPDAADFVLPSLMMLFLLALRNDLSFKVSLCPPWSSCSGSWPIDSFSLPLVSVTSPSSSK